MAVWLLSLPAIAAAQQIAIGEYPVPTASSDPAKIAVGPDGALWFTEYFGKQDRAHYHRRGDHRVPRAHGQ
jgi:streptogramin lyase